MTDFAVLDSGLRFAFEQMKEVETVSIAVFVKTGSRNENKSNNGVSHFLEHMAFKGTKSRSAKQIAEQFENIGGRINAYTSREKTVYYAKVLKQDLEFAVGFLADIVQNSVFDESELEKERGVILQEIAMTNDTPDDIIFDYFQQVAFPNQPIGRSILGPEKNIRKFTRDVLTDYVSKQYNYSNICVTAAGNLDGKKFSSYVRKYFNNLGSNQIKKLQIAEYQGGDFRKEKKDLEQINLVIGFKGYSYLCDDYYKSQILASIIGGGMSSRLFQEVREKRGLAYSVYAFSSPNLDSGIFGVYAATTENKVNELIEVVITELIKATKKITEAELKRAINQIKSGLLMSAENTNSRSQRLGSDILIYDRIIPQKEILDKISAISESDLSNLAQRIIAASDDKPSFAAIGKTSKIINYEKITAKF